MSEDKSLKTKAIKIKSKDYVLVKDRIIYFNDAYPRGCIDTQAQYLDQINAWYVRAVVRPDIEVGRVFTGHSQAVIGSSNINKGAALENAETSAVGRALAMMGIGVIDSIASVDELAKVGAGPSKYIDKKKQGVLHVIIKAKIENGVETEDIAAVLNSFGDGAKLRTQVPNAKYDAVKQALEVL